MSGFRKISTDMVDPRLLDAVGDFLLSRLRDDRPALIGLAGAQGSGKSTLAALLADNHGGVALSLDDVYLTRAQRRVLARDVHPLLATRGVPLTHDLGLLDLTLTALLTAHEASRTFLPVFDKLADDRSPSPRIFAGRPRFVILEGWCLGALPQPAQALDEPVNVLERDRDRDGRWRRGVNAALQGPYRELRERLDALAYLSAPGFESVLDWRCQQQAHMLGVAALDPLARANVAGFIRYFERLTRWMLAGGIDADAVFRTDNCRRLVA